MLSRELSRSIFPSDIRLYKVNVDYPAGQLGNTFKGQDALVTGIPGRPDTAHLRSIDAAIRAGLKRFVAFEYSDNTCAAASDLNPLYAHKRKVAAYFKT